MRDLAARLHGCGLHATRARSLVLTRLLACSAICRPLIYSCIGLATNRDVEDNRK